MDHPNRSRCTLTSAATSCISLNVALQLTVMFTLPQSILKSVSHEALGVEKAFVLDCRIEIHCQIAPPDRPHTTGTYGTPNRPIQPAHTTGTYDRPHQTAPLNRYIQPAHITALTKPAYQIAVHITSLTKPASHNRPYQPGAPNRHTQPVHTTGTPNRSTKPAFTKFD